MKRRSIERQNYSSEFSQKRLSIRRQSIEIYLMFGDLAKILSNRVTPDGMVTSDDFKNKI